MSDIEKVRAEHADRLLKKRNVVGTATGRKWVDGVPSEEEAVIIFVESKLPPGVVGPQAALPTKLDGIPTDIIEIGKLTKHGFRQRVRPVRPGYSCGHANVTAGTIGGIFLDRDGDHVILSNNHCLAAENQAAAGDLIFQPGPLDLRGSNRKFRGWAKADKLPYIATLKAFNKLNQRGNFHDSAVATVPKEVLDQGQLSLIFPQVEQAIAGFAAPTVGMSVQKCGRTTGHTAGQVVAMNGQFTIGYDFGNATFDDCIVCTGMSDSGDSGSAILDLNMNIVALLFAGSDKVTIGNPIWRVREHYGLELIPRAQTAKLVAGPNSKLTSQTALRINSGQLTFLEYEVSDFTSASCTITVNDVMDDHGPGITIIWPDGEAKLFLKVGGMIAIQVRDHEYFCSKKVVAGTYQLRVRWSEVDGTAGLETLLFEAFLNGKWQVLLELSNAIFNQQALAVRFGRTAKQVIDSCDYEITDICLY